MRQALTRRPRRATGVLRCTSAARECAHSDRDVREARNITARVVGDARDQRVERLFVLPAQPTEDASINILGPQWQALLVAVQLDAGSAKSLDVVLRQRRLTQAIIEEPRGRCGR